MIIAAFGQRGFRIPLTCIGRKRKRFWGLRGHLRRDWRLVKRTAWRTERSCERCKMVADACHAHVFPCSFHNEIGSLVLTDSNQWYLYNVYSNGHTWVVVSAVAAWQLYIHISCSHVSSCHRLGEIWLRGARSSWWMLEQSLLGSYRLNSIS